MSVEEGGDLAFDPGDAPREQAQHDGDVGPDGFREGLGETVLLLCLHAFELIGATAQPGQLCALCDEGGTGVEPPLSPHPGEHPRIDLVGLGQVQRLSEAPAVQEIGAVNGAAERRRLAEQKAVTAAGRLEDRQAVRPEPLQPCADRLTRVGDARPAVDGKEHVEPLLEHIDADMG